MKTIRLDNPSGQPAPQRRARLPAGWRQLATRLRGTRLYQITRATGGVYWEAGVKLHDEFVRRRFAAELHARAWLALATDHTPTATPFNLEELHGHFRLAGIAASRSRPARRE
jgi:hypothetical protein